jgi:hypothetical protein
MPDRRQGAARRCRLPARLRPFFWDQRIDRLRWPRDQDFITGRLLADGDWHSLRWLRRRLGDDALRAWLVRRRGAGLSPRQLRFWELILYIPARTVTRWLKDPGRQIWDRRRKPDG